MGIEPQRGADPDVILAEMLLNTDILLDRLFKHHPHVQVYQFGYEIMDWPASAHCRTYGYNLLHKVCPLGVDDVDCCNKQFVKYMQTGYVDVLGARYAGRHPYYQSICWALCRRLVECQVLMLVTQTLKGTHQASM